MQEGFFSYMDENIIFEPGDYVKVVEKTAWMLWDTVSYIPELPYLNECFRFKKIAHGEILLRPLIKQKTMQTMNPPVDSLNIFRKITKEEAWEWATRMAGYREEIEIDSDAFL